MQRLFQTSGLSLLQNAVVIAVGVVVFAMLEIEKHMRRIYVSNASEASSLKPTVSL
jgi:hypothetical protein